jgi:hypothetical protein
MKQHVVLCQEVIFLTATPHVLSHCANACLVTIQRRPSRIPGRIPFYSISYTAILPIAKRVAISEIGRRVPEQPAAPHPAHEGAPAAMSSGIEAIELPHAPGSIVERIGRRGI